MPVSMPSAPHAAVDWGIVAVFAIVYLGMFLGGLPKLRLDRSGVALLGAIAVIGIGGHARIGVPITLATLAIVWLWLRWLA